MKNEIYVLIVLVIVVLGVLIYLRLFYQPAISLQVSMSIGAKGPFYPYETIPFVIHINNTGSAPAKNLTFGIYVNDTPTMIYKVTLPGHKATAITYNYTPIGAANYSIVAVADPGKLYNIQNRQLARASANITVYGAENAMPYELLPYGNITKETRLTLSGSGYITAAYLQRNYNITALSLTDISSADSFFASILGYVSSYIKEIAVANAQYANGSKASSIWLLGYISPNMTNAAARLTGKMAENMTIANKTVTMVKIGKNATLCSYYSKGWIKFLAFASNGNSTCADMLQAKKANTTYSVPFENKTRIYNATLLGNYTEFSQPNKTGAGSLYLLSGTNTTMPSLVVASIFKNLQVNNTCYGLISNIANKSYCSEYVFPVTKTFNSNDSLIDTFTGINSYNLSVLSLVNTSSITAQVPINIGIINSFGFSGNTIAFESGIKNTCSFNTTFSCSNVTFYNGTIAFSLSSNKTAKLNSISCYEYPPSGLTILNKTISSGRAFQITTQCYDAGSVLSGMALNLHLRLMLNYTIDNKTQVLIGNAFIPISSIGPG